MRYRCRNIFVLFFAVFVLLVVFRTVFLLALLVAFLIFLVFTGSAHSKSITCQHLLIVHLNILCLVL